MGNIKVDYTFDKKFKNWQNSKNVTLRIMPIVMKLLLVIVSKYSIFRVDSFQIIKQAISI